MKEALLRAIPEFGEIEDTALKEKALAVWEEALTQKGWNVELLMRMPFTLLVEDVPISFVEHVRTVCQMCMRMDETLRESYGNRVTIDRDHLITGALLADVGKIWEYDEVDGRFVKSRHGTYLRHPFTGVGLAFKHGLPDEVMHIIAVHSKEGDDFKRSPEAIIFHHADFTDFEIVGG